MHRIARILAPLLIVVIVACSPSGPTTPPEGSAEREAIFAAMRQGREIQDQFFVTTHFKVQNGWAWTVGDPQSSDGKSRYERESALLRNSGSGWKVLDQPYAEADCDDIKEIARIRATHPQAPAGIFPK